jgi:hypothetical protein
MVCVISQTAKRVVRPSPLGKQQLFIFSSCRANTQEASRYEPFTRLANTALQAWESLAGDLQKLGFPTSPSGGSRLIFQRNDPARVPSVHKGLDLHLLSDDTLRSPDVIAIQLGTAMETRLENVDNPKGNTTTHDQWQHYADNFASRNPVSVPSFADILFCLEFKLNKNKLPQVPKIFQDKDIFSCRMANPLAYTHDHITFQRAYGPSKSSLSSQASTTVASSTSYNDKGSKTEARTSGVQNHRKATSHNSDTAGSKDKRAKKGPFARNQQFREGVADTHPTHMKDENVKSRKLPASVQSAIYAAERLSSSVAIAHCLNAVIIGSYFSLLSGKLYSNHERLLDEHLWLWWYDRGGAVQSYGLDFVTDFPYLLDLFAILAHFNDKAWGFLKDIFPLSEDKQMFRVTLDDTEFDILDSLAPKNLTLFGRATTVCPVKSNDVHPLDLAEGLDDEELIAKIYWPEDARTNEKDLLDLAYAIGSQSNGEDVRGHLPVLVASGTFFGQDADAVKRKKILQLPNHRYISRCIRILIFYKLRPIWELAGEDFLTAWVDCLRCEFCGPSYHDTSDVLPQVTGLCGAMAYIIATSALTT